MRLSMWKCFPKIDEYEKLMADKGRFQSGVVLSQVQIKEQMNGSRCSGRTEGRVSGLVKAEILAGRLIFMQIFTA